MNRTKDDLVKLLTVMSDSAWFFYTEFKQDRKSSMKNHYFGEYEAYAQVIRMLTEPEYMEKLWSIFLPDEEVTP